MEEITDEIDISGLGIIEDGWICRHIDTGILQTWNYK